MMAAGVPSATTCPRSRITIRSHSRSASSTSWVTRTTVVPASRTRRTTSHVWRRPTGSRFWVSSSRNTSSGRPTSARATKSRWRSPPDSAANGPAEQVGRAATPPPARRAAAGAGGGRRTARAPRCTRRRSGRAASWSWLPMRRRSWSPAALRVEAEHRTRRRCPGGGAPAGSRRWSSCRRRWCRAARTARPGARRTRCRAAPRWCRSSAGGRGPRRGGRRGRCGRRGGGRERRQGGHGAIVRPRVATAHRPTVATWAPPGVGVDDPVVVGEHDGRRPIAHAELREDRADVGLHGGLADDERLRRSRCSWRHGPCGAARRALGR